MNLLFFLWLEVRNTICGKRCLLLFGSSKLRINYGFRERDAMFKATERTGNDYKIWHHI
jgi:hypothetical protein